MYTDEDGNQVLGSTGDNVYFHDIFYGTADSKVLGTWDVSSNVDDSTDYSNTYIAGILVIGGETPNSGSFLFKTDGSAWSTEEGNTWYYSADDNYFYFTSTNYE